MSGVAGSKPLALVAGALVLAGVAIRLFQYPQQVLLDDEWHAIHQLLSGKSPGELLLSLGHADYSIPLGLLYWLEMRWFGLSEWAMRWPMLLAGLATLVALPAWAFSRLSPRIAVIFAGLLAASPLLLIYTHTARPYALTLFLSLLGIYAFDRYAKAATTAPGWGLSYVLCCALGAWLHPIVAPLLFAPLVLESACRLAGKPAVSWRRILAAGLPATLLATVLVMPAIIADPAGVTLKTGEASVGLATVWGALHSWLGVASGWIALALLGLAGLGFGRLLREHRLARVVALGLFLTLLALLLLRPAWVHHPLTFARYLLAAVPLLLLAVACGVDRLLRIGAGSRWLLAPGLVLLAAAYAWQSPLHFLLAKPNSHVTQARFQFDFRPAHNRVARYQRETLPVSPFWDRLSAEPGDSLRIAAAPFYFETHHWDGPRWEQASGQRVWPAFLAGFCADRRPGEVPDNGRFALRNAWWLSRIATGEGPPPDWLVFTRPIPRFADVQEGENMRAEFARCTRQLQESLGPPDYADDVLLAWQLAP